MKTFLVRGVPASLQQDSWWMDGPIRRTPAAPSESTGALPGGSRMALLAGLICLADLLFWGAAPVLALALFGLCLLGAALVLMQGRGWGGLVIGLVSSLPVLEAAQALSYLFWVAGLLTGGVWIALGGWRGLQTTATASLRLGCLGMVLPVFELIKLFQTQNTAPHNSFAALARRFMRGWAVPLGLGLVFASLLVSANPLVSTWIDAATTLRGPSLARLLFWGGMACLIWPFLRLGVLQAQLMPEASQNLTRPWAYPSALNAVSVRNALILFNALFFMQTALDAAYLWGGATLPDGMSHAEYAHRGAYPLLATALLAGAFALVARPFSETAPLLRVMLMIWVGQTILLVASSLLRLELYVEVYGLTRLRMAATLWMGVVALGLGLTLWQILRHHSAAWLLKRCAMLGVVTLYGACFVSFDRQIARYNLTHPVPQDAAYICTLGASALPEIRRHAPALCDSWRGPYAPYIMDWREWGFRDWRVLRSLSAMNTDPHTAGGALTWPRS